MIAAAVAAATLAVVLRWRPAPPRLSQCRTRARPERRPPTTTADEWAAFLDAVAAEVRGGASLSTAITHAEHRLGTTLPPPLVRPNALPDRDTAVVRQVIDTARVLGGPVAAIIDSGASVLRERSAARADLNAHAAQGRLSARVLTAVPLCFAGFSLATSESFRSAFLSPVGLVAGAGGGACNVAGWWWMRRLITKAAP